MIGTDTFQYDAFISHAVEDKMPIANELCARLEQAGLRIWYSGRELRVGDRLTETIEEGLAKSRFGIVILSPTYVSKMWTLREFYSLLSREKEGRKVILPILYDITPEQLAQKDLTMAELFSLRAEKGMDYLLDVLVKEIRHLKKEDRRRSAFKLLTDIRSIISFVVVLIALASLWLNQPQPERFDETLFTPAMMTRIDDIGQRVGISFLAGKNNAAVTVRAMSAEYTSEDGLRGYYRTEYQVVDKEGRLHYKKNVEEQFEVRMDSTKNNSGLRIFQARNDKPASISGNPATKDTLRQDSLHSLPDANRFASYHEARSRSDLALALESLLDDDAFAERGLLSSEGIAFGVSRP